MIRDEENKTMTMVAEFPRRVARKQTKTSAGAADEDDGDDWGTMRRRNRLILYSTASGSRLPNLQPIARCWLDSHGMMGGRSVARGYVQCRSVAL